MVINVLLFDNFETLDAFGPVEVLGNRNLNQIKLVSAMGGAVKSAHGFTVETIPAADACFEDVLLIPGGMGTRTKVNEPEFLALVKKMAESASYVLTVCTGSALLAKSGAIDGKRATSNKQAMNWVKTTSDKVEWVEKARWVVDGKFYTSSGISAGMDMAMGFVNDILGAEMSEKVGRDIEYIWNEDPDQDPFAIE